MTALLSVALLVAGAALLTAGAEAFAEHVTEASARLGVSVLALGILLAGAEPEEAVTAMVASGRGHPALAAGDAVGANLVILTLTIGLAACLVRLPVSRRVVEYAVAASVVGAVAVVFLWTGVLGRVEGTVLVLVYVAGVAWVWWREKQPPVLGELAALDQPDDTDDTGDAGNAGGDPARPLLFLLLGLLGMVTGGYLAVRGAEGMVGWLGATESVVGLTVLALATSAEMVALVWAAGRRGVSELVVAGVVGSVAYNATVSLGLAALVSPLGLGRHSPVLGVAMLTAVLPLVLLLGRPAGHLPRPVGMLLLVAYLACTGWLFTS